MIHYTSSVLWSVIMPRSSQTFQNFHIDISTASQAEDLSTVFLLKPWSLRKYRAMYLRHNLLFIIKNTNNCIENASSFIDFCNFEAFFSASWSIFRLSATPIGSAYCATLTAFRTASEWKNALILALSVEQVRARNSAFYWCLQFTFYM